MAKIILHGNEILRYSGLQEGLEACEGKSPRDVIARAEVSHADENRLPMSLVQTKLRAIRAVKKILSGLPDAEEGTEVFSMESGIDRRAKRVVTVCAYGKKGESEVFSALSDESPEVDEVLLRSIRGRESQSAAKAIATYFGRTTPEAIQWAGLTTLVSHGTYSQVHAYAEAVQNVIQKAQEESQKERGEKGVC